jgi:VanZ family protein
MALFRGALEAMKNQRHHRFVRSARALLAVALLFVLYEATEKQPLELLLCYRSDKLLHGMAFFLLSSLVDMAFPASRLLFWKVLFLAVFGIFIELVQVYLPWRSAEVMDFIADCIGIALYLISALLVRQMLKRRSS